MALGAGLAAMLISGPAWAYGKGAMELGLSSHYDWPGMDASVFDPAFDYGLVFHYWLNDRSSIMAGFDQLAFSAPFEVDGSDEGLDYTSSVFMGGLRYRPEMDFALRPYLEGGVGYESWTVKPGGGSLDNRSGSSVAYFAGTGLEYEIRRALTVGVNYRYLFYSMKENLEREAVSVPGGNYDVSKDPFKSVGFGTLGIELTWRIR